MLPGQVEVFYLSDELESIELLHEQLAQGGSFEEAPGGWTSGVYPSTLMGVMAKFRQLMFDAEALQQHIKYYTQNPEMPAPDRDPGIEALFPLLNKEVPIYFEVDQKEHIERLLKLKDEFGFDVVIVSGKEAYAKADDLKSRNIPVELKDLATKLEILLDEGSLSEDEALKLMTQNTSKILGLDDRLGSLEEGKNASFSVFSKPFSEEKAKVLHSISNGTIHELNGE